MRKMLAFARRNLYEILRDPISYVFCLAFPLVMLALMTLVNRSIPPEANMTLFRIDRLAGGIAVFGQSFLMLFTVLAVSKDRAGSFLVRLYATPMTASDFTAGYLLPILLLSAAQTLLLSLAAWIVSLVTGPALSVGGLLLMTVTLIPSGALYAGIGLLFGTLFSEKAAPALSSIVISLGAVLGGIWFDPDSAGGVLLRICQALPFRYAVQSARAASVLELGWETWGFPLAVVCAFAVPVTILASLVFRTRMRADLN